LELDDVNLAILGGCHTAEANAAGTSVVTAFTNAGVDIVMGWKGEQDSDASLFVKYFLQRAFQQASNAVNFGVGVDVSWTNYPKVWEARDAAYVDLVQALGTATNSATYVYTNCVIDGYTGTNAALNMKIFPPRYGADDKED
jgi:hypothetical protein